MKNCIFRPARQEDLVDIIENWQGAFGDEPPLIRSLLLDCGMLENTLVAQWQNRVVCSILLFEGLALGNCRAGYLYALCTRDDCRGRGIASSLLDYAAQCAQKRGTDFLLLQPGDRSLELWYGAMGYGTVWRSRWETLDVSSVCGCDVQNISHGEYLCALDKACLATKQILACQAQLSQSDRGCFFRCGASLFCAEPDGPCLRIRHFGGSLAELKSAAAALGAKKLSYLLRDDENGSTALMYLPLADTPLPRTEGLFFPFTLD